MQKLCEIVLLFVIEMCYYVLTIFCSHFLSSFYNYSIVILLIRSVLEKSDVETREILFFLFLIINQPLVGAIVLHQII